MSLRSIFTLPYLMEVFRPSRKLIVIAAATTLAGAGTAYGQQDPGRTEAPLAQATVSPAKLGTVTVKGNYDNAVGTSDAASQGSVTAKLIESRPTSRPAEVLEFVPGVIVSQHSGDGKANQYYLRGFNLDHGTDFATFVAGMPVNMVTHAHGQGYSDLNWLIPELVSRIAYKKGPYYADEGDFASAGTARISLFDALPKGTAALTIGEHRFARAVLADSAPFASGTLLYAVEAAHNNGPWDNPERFHRLNGVLRYGMGDASARSALTLMGYSAAWNSTDQIPQRAVDQGLVGRFGAIDPTDGGFTSRYSLSFEHERKLGDGAFKLNAYAIQSKLDLYSNFTFFLEHPIDLAAIATNGDQFEQAERRRLIGLATSRSWNTTLAGRDSVTTLGLQLRHDRLDPVGLYSTVARERIATTQESTVRETSAALYAENATQLTPWLRSVAGARVDRLDFQVDSSIVANSGRKSESLVSPKLSLIFGPWARTEYFLNYGSGFHSNDARGVNATVTPKEGIPTEPSPGLVRSRGAEVGLRTEIIPGLQTSIAVWQLKLGSELVFSGDAGDTEASGATKRTGIELNNHYAAASWLLLDADLAFSRARFTEEQGGTPNVGRFIPGAVETVASLGATVTEFGPWFGHLQLRYFGPRALIEDNSKRSKATVLAYARLGYKISKDVKLMLDVFNLFDRKASDIDYYYASRLKGEVADGVSDVHFHPVEPRSFRLTLSANF